MDRCTLDHNGAKNAAGANQYDVKVHEIVPKALRMPSP